MRGKLISSLAFASCILVLSSCQETPDKDIIANKNEGVLESKIADTGTSSAVDVVSDSGNITSNFVTDIDDINVNIDAKLEELADAYPVIRVRPHEITPDEVRHWAEVLFEGNTAYEPDRQLTKGEIEERILEYKERMDGNALIEEYGSEEAAQPIIEDYQKLISNLEELYKTAPDKKDKKESDWQFHPYEYYNDNEFLGDASDLKDNYELNLEAEVDGREAVIAAVNRNADDFMLHSISFYYTDIPGDYEKKSISEAEAVKIVNPIVDELVGLDQWNLNKVDISEDENLCSVILHYTPIFNQMDSILVSEVDSIKSEDEYAANYYYESLEVQIYNGVLSYIILTSPVDVAETVNENVELMPVTNIVEAAADYMKVQFSDEQFVEGAPEDFDIETDINEIKLGLFRIKEKNSDSFLMVPAWVFYGDVAYQAETMNEEGKQLLAVNAVDGSIINIQLGY